MSKKYVYFVQAGEDGPVKVGISARPEERVSCITSNSPIPCRLIGYIEGSVFIEEYIKLHFMYARSHGEWFVQDEKITSEINGFLETGVFRETSEPQLSDVNLDLPALEAHFELTASEISSLLGRSSKAPLSGWVANHGGWNRSCGVAPTIAAKIQYVADIAGKTLDWTKVVTPLTPDQGAA